MTDKLDSPWGIDVIEQEEKNYNKEVEAKQAELNKSYALCFSTPTGKKVLEHLKACTTDQPTWIPNGNNGSSAEQFAFVREGQNSITRNIIDRINSINNKKS